MKPISSFFFALFLLSLLSLSLFPNVIVAHPTNSTNLIEKACAQSPHKEFCITTLQSDPESQKVTNLTGLAEIALNQAQSFAQKTKFDLSDMMDTISDDYTSELLMECGSDWRQATNQMEYAIKALSKRDCNGVFTEVKLGIKLAHTCENLLKQQKGTVFTVTHSYRVFRRLCSNALIITRLLAKH